MIGDSIDLTYNSVTKTLVKINQDNYGAVYYLDDTSNSMSFTLNISHTIPKNGTGESHLVRLDIDNYDAEGVSTNKHSVWTVMKTNLGRQAADTDLSADALIGWLTPTNVDKVLGRQS